MTESGQPEISIPTAHPDFPDSAVEDHLQEAEVAPSAVPPIKVSAQSIHSFPRGPGPGTFLHGLLEWAAGEGFAEVAKDRECQDLQHIDDSIRVYCERRGRGDWAPLLTDWLQNLLQTPLILPAAQGRVKLADLVPENYQSEMEFLFAAHQVETGVLDEALTTDIMPGSERPRLRENRVNGMLKGFIDLVFCHRGRYYVLDYKSNYLGENDQAYGAKAVAEGMLEHRYDLQYVLYTLALHRLLKARLADYDYDRDMGGAIYLFLRGVNAEGQGIYVDRPSRALIEKLDDYFAGKENHHAA